MLKGVQRRMVVVRPERSHCYEVAYFVLRSDRPQDGCDERALLREANRILLEGRTKKRQEKKEWRTRLCLLLFGFLGGAATAGIAWLCCVL